MTEVPLTHTERRVINRLSKQNAITPEEIVLACVKLGLPLVEASLRHSIAPAEALEHVTSPAYDSTPVQRFELRPEAAARLDGISERLMRHYGLDQERAQTMAVEALIRGLN